MHQLSHHFDYQKKKVYLNQKESNLKKFLLEIKSLPNIGFGSARA